MGRTVHCMCSRCDMKSERSYVVLIIWPKVCGVKIKAKKTTAAVNSGIRWLGVRRRFSVGFLCTWLKKKEKIMNWAWSHSSRLKVTWNDSQVEWSCGTWPDLTWLKLGFVSQLFGLKSQVAATLERNISRQRCGVHQPSLETEAEQQYLGLQHKSCPSAISIEACLLTVTSLPTVGILWIPTVCSPKI
jgi:hypothetical protein